MVIVKEEIKDVTRNGRSASSSSDNKKKPPTVKHHPPPPSMDTNHANQPSALLSVVRWITRWILLDLPLLLVLLLYVSLFAVNYMGDKYLIPQLYLMQFTNSQRESSTTYYHRYCDETAQTAFDSADMILPQKNTTTNDALDRFLTHGVSILANLLTPSTCMELRRYILDQNEKLGKELYVIENEHRWSFPIQVDQHPIIQHALSELLNNSLLVDLLEAIAGPNPAVIEFTAITAEYGAKEQYWHQDVTSEGNSMKYGRNFVPSYSLFVPLQNTTAGMGATGICPGTHMCPEGTDDFCPQTAFQASGKANNWEMGAGALVSQQTTHRGEAFTDPRGPKRVLFILTFAPRPQTAPKTLETRMIGVSGSYSLHWSQWGHTLRDFQKSQLYMRQPWRSLRSMGLYKLPGRQWGWDYVTSTSGRIVHSEYGYGYDEFEEFINRKGGFSWLPKQLHGGTEFEGVEDGMVWMHFFKDTAEKCLKASERVYFSVLAAFASLSLLLAFVRRKQRSFLSSIANSVFHLVIIHAVVLGIAWYIRQQLERGSWARNIRKGVSFSIERERALAPDLPGVLPNEDDIFIVEGLQSEYLYSNSVVLDYTHPGNVEWKRLVNHYGPGYRTLTAELRRNVCDKLLSEVHNDSRRILIQNHRSNWAEVSKSYAAWYCHKSLRAWSDERTKAAVKITDHLLSESRFGYWRETKMHRRHASKYSTELQDRILNASRSDEVSLPNRSLSLSRYRVVSHLMKDLPTGDFGLRERSLLPPETVRQEPWTGAWIKEGDIVEATFDDEPDEWYRATVIRASANRMVWEIAYDDGDFGKNVCQDCVRPFVPYQMDETIEMRVSEDFFAPVKVVAINDDGTFDLKLIGTTRIHQDVASTDLRRVTVKSFEPIAVTSDIKVNSNYFSGL